MIRTGWKKNVLKPVSVYLKKSLYLLDERIAVIKLLIARGELRNAIIPVSIGRSNNSKFQWTANVTDLVELIYALYYSHCINDGNVTLKQIVTAFERLFKIKIPNSSHTFGKNCDRVDRTPFIQKLHQNLQSKIADKDK